MRKKPAKKSSAEGTASARKASGAPSRNPKKSHAQPVRAAIYARFNAIPNGNDDHLIRQIDACKRAAAENGWTIVEDSVFIDDGTSSHPTPRPGLSKLLRAVSATLNRFNVVICNDTSRLARNLHDCIDLLQKFRMNGVEVHFADPLEEKAWNLNLGK